MAKVSIIVPIYNVEKYLHRCVDSIINQSYKDLEIILVDDESPDKCPEMCDEYAQQDSRIKVIHKKNGGLGYARNSGLEIATGEYVAFIDSDDYVELDMVEKLYNDCCKNNLDAIFADFYVDGNTVLKKSPTYDKFYNSPLLVEELRLDMIGTEPEYPSCSKNQYSVWRGLYSLRTIKENKIVFPSEREYISEDIIFNLDFLFHSKKVKTVSEKFYHYCFNDISLSHSYRKDRWEKQVFLLKQIALRVDEFADVNDFRLRIGKTALAYSKIAINHEVKRNISLYDKFKNINLIIGTPDFLSLMQNYPIGRLPFKWRLYANLVRFKLSILIYLLLK